MSLILCKIDLSTTFAEAFGEKHESAVNSVRESVTAEFAKSIKGDFDVVVVDSRIDITIMSDIDLKNLGLTRTKNKSGDLSTTVDQNGDSVPKEVIKLVGERARAFNEGDMNKCVELRDSIRVLGYEIKEGPLNKSIIKK